MRVAASFLSRLYGVVGAGPVDPRAGALRPEALLVAREGASEAYVVHPE